MSRGRTGTPASNEALVPAIDGKQVGAAAPTAIPKTAPRTSKRRRRATADFEKRIGYRFNNPALLEQALTHISALTGARNRAGSYQRQIGRASCRERGYSWGAAR